ncbi:Transcriptional regulatory protein FixJ [Gammaproteobacteria bacterium]
MIHTPTPPTVFVVDDDFGMQDSLRELLESVQLSFRVFSSGQAFLNEVTPAHAGCVLLDIRMPGMSGLELYRRMVGRDILLPVIIITGHPDVRTAVQAMKAGAIDFLEKPFNDHVLLQRINEAIERDTQNRKLRAEQEAVSHRLASLSPRESEVLASIVEGKRNKLIASDLDINEKTVEAHRSHIMEKMASHSAVDLVKKVIVHKYSTDGSLISKRPSERDVANLANVNSFV